MLLLHFKREEVHHVVHLNRLFELRLLPVASEPQLVQLLLVKLGQLSLLLLVLSRLLAKDRQLLIFLNGPLLRGELSLGDLLEDLRPRILALLDTLLQSGQLFLKVIQLARIRIDYILLLPDLPFVVLVLLGVDQVLELASLPQ